MAPSSKVQRGEGAIFIEFGGRDAKAIQDLSLLIRTFLEGSMFRVENLSPFVETTTLKVYDE